MTVLVLAAFAAMLFGEPRVKSGATPKPLSYPLPVDDCVEGDIKPKVR